VKYKYNQWPAQRVFPHTFGWFRFDRWIHFRPEHFSKEKGASEAAFFSSLRLTFSERSCITTNNGLRASFAFDKSFSLLWYGANPERIPFAQNTSLKTKEHQKQRFSVQTFWNYGPTHDTYLTHCFCYGTVLRDPKTFPRKFWICWPLHRTVSDLTIA